MFCSIEVNFLPPYGRCFLVSYQSQKFNFAFYFQVIMKMDLERIGGRHRDNSHHFAAESEALDQIAKEVKV